MDIGLVSTRYAKALLRFSEENKEESKVYQEMLPLSAAFIKVKALQPALLNPVLSDEQKVQLLSTACTPQSEVSASTLRFIELVVQKKRTELMHFIALTFQSLYCKSKGIVKGKLIVPTLVSERICQRLQQVVESKTQSKIEFEVCVDEKIGGGFILEYDTYRLDASLRTQLDQIHRELKSL